MGRPYSTDLRERVLLACEAGDASGAELARPFRVSASAVSSWQRLARLEGRRTATPHGRGAPSVVDAESGAVLRALVEEDNDATLAEYARAFTARPGEAISAASVCRALQRQGLIRKKRPFTRASKTDRMWPLSASLIRKPWPTATRPAWSFSMRRGSKPL
jgi:transposase